jgi:lysophospholipase L1-like esterase
MTQFLVFGDSIAYGAWDESGGWVQRLRTFIERKYPREHVIYNMGISGDTSEFLLERLESETKRRSDFGDSILIFSIGANDSAIMVDKLWVDEKIFANNIKKIIEVSRKLSKSTFFVEAVPMDESKTHPVPWDKRVTYTNENIKKYNDILRSVCKQEGVNLIPLFDEFSKANYKKLLADGAHPNSEGHEKIFKIVRDYLIKNKII